MVPLSPKYLVVSVRGVRGARRGDGVGRATRRAPSHAVSGPPPARRAGGRYEVAAASTPLAIDADSPSLYM